MNSKAYCNDWTGCNWVVLLAGHTGWLGAAHRNRQPAGGRQEGPVAAAGFVAGTLAAVRSLLAEPGNQAVAGHSQLAGCSCSGCNLLAGC